MHNDMIVALIPNKIKMLKFSCYRGIDPHLLVPTFQKIVPSIKAVAKVKKYLTRL